MIDSTSLLGVASADAWHAKLGLPEMRSPFSQPASVRLGCRAARDQDLHGDDVVDDQKWLTPSRLCGDRYAKSRILPSDLSFRVFRVLPVGNYNFLNDKTCDARVTALQGLYGNDVSDARADNLQPGDPTGKFPLYTASFSTSQWTCIGAADMHSCFRILLGLDSQGNQQACHGC